MWIFFSTHVVGTNSEFSFGLLAAKDIIFDLDAEAEDCYVAMEALSEVFRTSILACSV